MSQQFKDQGGAATMDPLAISPSSYLTLCQLFEQ
jgi:hypothetical protein